MQIDVAEVGIAIGVPSAALLAGVAGGAWLGPGPRVRSACQHLAGGIIFVAVATELVPVMVEASVWAAVLAGFAAGLGLMLGLRALGGGDTESRGLGAGMLAGIGVDLLIDGLLIALALGGGAAGGMVLAGGMSFETLFLGLALAAGAQRMRRRLVIAAVALAAVLVAGGVGGLLLLAVLNDAWQAGLMAFGAVALLYLVTEELLVEAHGDNADTIAGTAMFFAGFGGTIAIAAASG